MIILLIGFMIKYFHYRGASQVLFFGIINYALFFIMQLILYPVTTDKDNETLHKKWDWWPIMKWIWSLGVLLSLMGTSWKGLHLPGAAASITSGLILNIFCGLYFLLKIVERNWMNYVVGISFIITAIAMLNKYYSILSGVFGLISYEYFEIVLHQPTRRKIDEFLGLNHPIHRFTDPPIHYYL